MKIWKIFILIVIQMMVVRAAEARICLLPFGELCDIDVAVKTCSACYSKDDGYNCKACASNPDLCECTVIECALGYSAEQESCPEGYRVETSGKSGGRDCIRCVNSGCPEGSDVNPNCGEDYRKVPTEYLSGDELCYKCVSDVCPEGTFKSCPENSEISSGGKTAYGTPCYFCEKTKAPLCGGDDEYAGLEECMDGLPPQYECHKVESCYIRRKICAIKSALISYEFRVENKADGSRKLVAEARNCDDCRHTVGISSANSENGGWDYGWTCDHETEISPVAEGEMFVFIDVNGQITKQTPVNELSKILSVNWEGYVLHYSRSAHSYGSWALFKPKEQAYYSAQVVFLDNTYKRYKIELKSIAKAQKFELIFNMEDFPLNKYDYADTNAVPANKQCFESDGFYGSMESCMKPHQHKDLQPYLYASLGGFEIYDQEGYEDFPQHSLPSQHGGSFLGLYAKYPEHGDCFCTTNNIGSGSPLFGGKGYFALSDCCLDILESNISQAKRDDALVALFLSVKQEAWKNDFKKDVTGAYNDALGLTYKCVYHKASGCYVKIMNKEKECFDFKNAHFKFSCSSSADKVVCQFTLDNSYSNFQKDYLGLYRYDGYVTLYNENTKETTTEYVSAWTNKPFTFKGKGLKVLGCSISRDDTPSVVGDDWNTHLLWETTDPNCALDKTLGENCSLKD